MALDSGSIVRVAAPDDLGNLLQLIVEATAGKTQLTSEKLDEALFQPTRVIADIKSTNENIEMDRNLFKTNRRAARAIVAEVDGSLVGFILWHHFYSPWPGTCFHVDKIYVNPEFRYKGVAKRMMDLLREISSGEKIHYFYFSMEDENDKDILSRLTGGSKIIEYRNDKSDWSVLRIDLKE